MMLKTIREYLTCPINKEYWTKAFSQDVSLLGFDFSVMAAWFWFPEIFVVVGQTTGIIAGLLGIYLTALRIVHVRKQIKKLDTNTPLAGDA